MKKGVVPVVRQSPFDNKDEAKQADGTSEMELTGRRITGTINIIKNGGALRKTKNVRSWSAPDREHKKPKQILLRSGADGGTRTRTPEGKGF